MFIMLFPAVNDRTLGMNGNDEIRYVSGFHSRDSMLPGRVPSNSSLEECMKHKHKGAIRLESHEYLLYKSRAIHMIGLIVHI